MTKVITTNYDSLPGVDSKVTYEHDIEIGPEGFLCLVHQQGIRVDVPDHVEIDISKAIACLKAMNQTQWEWISKGGIFGIAFNAVFSNRIQIPQLLSTLLEHDLGVQHMAGGIIMMCEAFFAGKNVFWRNPENSLHPSSEQTFMDMIEKMLKICRVKKIATKVAAGDPNIDDAPKIILPDSTIERSTALKWLQAAGTQGLDAPFATIGNATYTIAELIEQVTNDTPVGQKMIELLRQVYKNH